MCGVLCGLDGLSELVIFAESRILFFQKHFGIAKIPSKSTFSRILSMINGEKVAKIIIDLMKESIENTQDFGEILAVDGKAIRSTSEKGKPHSGLQILTAYLTESGVILGQQAINEKTNEIPIFQEMLEYLDIKGKIITADAMHCQNRDLQKNHQQKRRLRVWVERKSEKFLRRRRIIFQ
jgi:hypothetical protein